MVSIIIATFNSAATLKNSLESIIRLNFNDWECIIVDGCSSDATIETVKVYSSKDTRFHFISEKDDGIYDALNKGINMSVGEWIYVLGSDDEVTSNGIGELLSIAEDTDDIVYGNVYCKYSNGHIRQSLSKSPKTLKHRMCACHQGMIMKKNTIVQLGGFNCKYKILADFDLIQRAYLSGFHFKKSEVFVAIFSHGGLSTNNVQACHQERYDISRCNHSTKIPFLWLLFYRLKWGVKQLIKS